MKLNNMDMEKKEERNIYKMGSRNSKYLKFETKYGLITMDQLWTVELPVIKDLIKNTYEEKKSIDQVDEELSFLEGPLNISEKERKRIYIINLKFDILKDIWETRKKEEEEKSASIQKKMEIRRIEQALAEKRETNLKGLSEEELLKKIKELEG